MEENKNEQELKPESHHRISPSALDRYAICPMSFWLSEGCPDVQSDAADYGTRLHAQMAEALSTIVNKDSHLVFDRPGTEWFGWLELNFPMEVIVSVQRFVDIVDAIQGGYIWTPFRMLLEHHVEIPLGDDDPLKAAPDFGTMFGTADVVCEFHDRKEALVVDWKFGYRNIPMASDTMQTAAYAVGVSDESGLKTVTAAIVAPHAASDMQGEKCAMKFTEDTLKFARSSVRGVVDRILDARKNIANAKALCVKGDNCTYCRAMTAGKCPVMMEAVEEITTTGGYQLESIAAMDDTQLSILKGKISMIDKISKAVDDEMKKRCLASATKSCGDYMLKEKNAPAEVEDLKTAFEAVRDFVTIDEFLSVCKLSVSKLKALYSQNAKEANFFPTKKAAEAEFSTIIQPLLVEKPPQTVLVRADG